MKPPPRQRSKPKRELSQSQVTVQRPGLLIEWKRKERYQLLSALKKLYKTAGGESEIDYVLLRKSVPTRTAFEIRSAVESLKNKVITSVKFKLHMQEKREKKPIELWTDLACVVAGKLVEPISAAFSQMLIVSSTEPRTLKNCYPPQVDRPSTRRGRPVSRTGPIGPAPRLHARGDSPGSKTTNATIPVPRLRAPAPSVGPALPAPSQAMRETSKPVPLCQQVHCTTAASPQTASVTSNSAASFCHSGAASGSVVPVPQTVTLVSLDYSVDSTGHAPPLGLSVSTVAAVKETTRSSEPLILHAPSGTSSSSEPRLVQSSGSQPKETAEVTACLQPLSTAAPVNPAGDAPSEQHPSTLTSSVPTSNPPSSTPDPPMSSSLTSAASSAVATVSPGSSKCSPPLLSTNSCPNSFDVKYSVDFEKIYRYLSAIAKQSEGCGLTPMESAILLDLIMSLPEELLLLDCKKLHKHLIQVQLLPEADEIIVSLKVQVYQCFTAPAHLKQAREMLKEFHPNEEECNKHSTATPHEGFSHTQAPSSDFTKSDPKQKKISTDTSSQRDTAEPTGASLDSAGQNSQSDNGQTESQSRGSDDASMTSDDSNVTWHCPPLNPFMVPLKLLMRR